MRKSFVLLRTLLVSDDQSGYVCVCVCVCVCVHLWACGVVVVCMCVVWSHLIIDILNFCAFVYVFAELENKIINLQECSNH